MWILLHVKFVKKTIYRLGEKYLQNMYLLKYLYPEL